jgi:hypothetical protein
MEILPRPFSGTGDWLVAGYLPNRKSCAATGLDKVFGKAYNAPVSANRPEFAFEMR